MKERLEVDQPSLDDLGASRGGRGANAQQLVDLGLARPTEESISLAQSVRRYRLSKTEAQGKEVDRKRELEEGNG